jgi:hypothetical protein
MAVCEPSGREEDPMSAQQIVSNALSGCPGLDTRSLEEFLNTLLDEDLDALAQMPGTPGQVMAAQFTHYARSSAVLAECLCRDKGQADRFADAVLRLPAARRKGKAAAQPRKEETRDTDPSRAQAPAAG